MKQEGFPDAAIAWILHNDCSSNVCLAILSNVCQHWREICSNTVAMEAISMAAVTIEKLGAEYNSSTVNRQILSEMDRTEASGNNLSSTIPSIQTTQTERKKSSSILRKLFLVDMARELLVRQYNSSHSTPDLKEMHRNTDGNFCLAWFTPAGIQITSVSLDSKQENPYSVEVFKDTLDNISRKEVNANVDAMSNTPSQQQQQKSLTIKSTPGGRSVSCSHEWRGYRHAMEVLAPFGFATYFDVLDTTSRLAFGDTYLTIHRKHSNRKSSMSQASSIDQDKHCMKCPSSKAALKRTSKTQSGYYNPTFSVRGATLARPEGFCLCFDDDFSCCGQTSNGRHPVDQMYECQNTNTNTSLESNDEQILTSHDHCNDDVSSLLSSRQHVKKLLTKAVLPRLIMSTRRKCPLLHRFLEAENNNGNNAESHSLHHHFHPEESTSGVELQLHWERRQRAIQFLNSDQTQAVKLITPPFDCGPVTAPITMFLVAISTEDGCFVSGRNSRFEFGHMYPLSSRDLTIDMSPLCIATDEGDNIESNIDKNSNGDCLQYEEDNDLSKSDDDSSCSLDRFMQCRCKFASCNPYHDRDISIRDPAEACIHRGIIGPGLWHCYVAVFDGASSIIRVDGRVDFATKGDYNSLEKDGSNEDKMVYPGSLVGSGVLDGLTIGSDHLFNMSLCCGEIDGECGEGAISELAVFKGKMDISDIKQLEEYLMQKHGILSVHEQEEFILKQNKSRRKPLNIGSHWKEDEWRRQAHALITQDPGWNSGRRPLPLRVAANHNLLAWKHQNNVTGMPLKVPKIGHETIFSSSDL